MLEVRYVYSKQACAQNLTPKKIKAVPNASREIVSKSNYKLNKLGVDHWNHSIANWWKNGSTIMIMQCIPITIKVNQYILEGL